MRKFSTLLYYIVIIVCFTACSQYSVIGSSDLSDIDGRTLYMKTIGLDSLTTVDSCSVVHGKKGNGGACFIENVIPELGRQTVVEVICYNGEDIDCKKHIYEKERSIQSRLF